MEEITLFAQPRDHKLCTEDFKALKIKEVTLESGRKSEHYTLILSIISGIVLSIFFFDFLLPFLTFIGFDVYFVTAVAFTVVMILVVLFVFALNSWFKKKGMIGAYIVPDVFERIIEYPKIRKSNKRFDVKNNSRLMGKVNWKGTIKTTINNRPFEIIFQYVNIDAWSFGGSITPSNNVCVIKLKADKDELRSFIKYLADTLATPWEIERKEKFTEKFDISLSEVKERWMKYME